MAVKKGWWCIADECNHYYNPLRCKHPSIKKELGKDKLKLFKLQMCPVLCSLEACLVHQKLDVRED